jgi:hypothetical protein
MNVKSCSFSLKKIFVLLSFLVFVASVLAPSLFAQVNIAPGGFTPVTVCASGSVSSGCQVVTNFNAIPNGGVLQLTASQGSQVGSAWSVVPQTVVNGFTTSFTFQLTQPSQFPGDGIAFVIQNSPSGLAAIGYTGGEGGAIGYGPDDDNYYPTTAIPNSLAIEFDTVDNGWDPNANHVAVQSCGTGYNTSHHNELCSSTGLNSTLGINAVLPITLADGAPHTVTILYNPPGTPCSTPVSATNNLCIYLDQATYPTPVLTVTADLSTLGLGTGGTAFVGFTSATGLYFNTQNVLSWTFSGVVTQPITVNTSGPGPILTADFSTPTGTVTTVTDYSTAGNGMSLPPGIITPILTTINNTLTQTTWPEYVVGTPWATSSCTAKAGNGGSGNLCSQYINECFDASLGATTASDANCPTVNNPGFANYVTLEDTFDWGTGGKQTIAPGTTVSLIAFSVPTTNPGLQWNASLPPATSNPVCASVPGTTAGSPCYLSDALVNMYGDQTTSRGSKPKSKAWLVSVYGVPMLTTTILAEPNPGTACPLTSSVVLNNPSSTVWVNGACLFDFQVNPAVPAVSTNNFQAAPPASLLYGPGTPAVAPGPIPSLDTLVSNPSPVCTGVAGSPCAPSMWDTQKGANAITVASGKIPATNPLVSSLGNNGSFPMHWSAIDNVGITEKSIQLVSSTTGCTLPDGSTVSGTQCYYTSYFTTQVNVDSVAPGISASFSPAGSPSGIFGLNQVVHPVYTCSDTLSGLANCGGITATSCPTTPTSLTSTTALNTSTAGLHSYTVTATDCAGNVSSPLTVQYTVAPSADVAIIAGVTANTSKSITYSAAVLDLTQNSSAYNVVITFQITDPKASVGGPITGVFADVSCSLLGCSELPAGPIACSTSGDTVTCNVGTLPTIFQLKGAVAQITIPVVAKPQSGATIGITATVSSDDDPNPKNNTASATVSVK